MTSDRRENGLNEEGNFDPTSRTKHTSRTGDVRKEREKTLLLSIKMIIHKFRHPKNYSDLFYLKTV